ncbi:MAG: D-alanyl-D-alanine dipeptidase [Ruminococcaceae bacterium]|nr:D-alanyl-D-alanine dipeptidase [Oscillospiraceae bacterium]
MNPIPIRAHPEMHTLLQKNNEPFVQLTEECGLKIRMQYPLLGMQNAENRCFVRKTVFEKLLLAQSFLPAGYTLCIWDAWRPFALQNELYETYKADILKTFSLENASEEEQEAVLTKFVAPPIADPLVPPLHATGGAVDVTILDKDGNELPMGTAFDAFTDKTQTAYFELHDENDENDEIRNNRRLLYHCMTKAGFESLPSEWWHYDYGNRFWGYFNNCPAVYEGIFTSDKINLLRKDVLNG